ncbi:ras-like GTP-binding protein RhoL [Daphnia carinata]|uniref:ras-like GTP-binding protein RhoL n=1 Tax=Daphnia carinata TaxID=120202 RepID=UPI00257C7D25|nr:ras-like GTP-binding protein RhoL [Daphnia carinata]
MNHNRLISVVIVGDGNSGKNCIFNNFKENCKEYPLDYVPTVFDNSSRTMEVDGIYYHVSLSYTTGQTEYDGLRILSYPSTDVFLLCYAVSQRTSFESLPSKWIPELKLHCPQTPIVLVGTKIDMRKDGSTSTDYVSSAEGKEMSKQVNGFIECSAKTGDNLREVSCEAVRAVRRKSKRRVNLKYVSCGCVPL